MIYRQTYDDEMLQQINENVDLLEYASQHMDLERHGKDYFAHCPLHVDITPSFSINPEKNLYYCFSCGRAGGIISFLMDFENMRFDDAVQKAASLAGLDLSKMCQSETLIFLRKIRNLLKRQAIAPYEHEILPESEWESYSLEPVHEWLEEGITQEVMDIFGVRVDPWRNRIVYPVRDIHGRLINIKGRTRYPDYKALKMPKYINYRPVGVMDYFQGLDITLPHVRQAGEIIIFESIKSVMKAYSWGYKNCASAEKHNLTPEQVQLLVKLRVNVVFAYDSDVNYWKSETREDINRLKRITNVFYIEDRNKLLGGADAKNAPVDLGRDIWEELYESKRKVV